MLNLARGTSVLRKKLPFRSVNRRDSPGYEPGMQRHHLLPRQLLQQNAFGQLFDHIGRDRIGFDDFRSNGLLLPSSDEAALRMRMPLHRGPHRDYNGVVAERVGQIETDWSRLRLLAPEIALDQARMRLDLLQRALRRRLLAADRRQLRLNRHDPIGHGLDFAELDAMADVLWAGTAIAIPAEPIAPGSGAGESEAPLFAHWATHPLPEPLVMPMPAAPACAQEPATTCH